MTKFLIDAGAALGALLLLILFLKQLTIFVKSIKQPAFAGSGDGNGRREKQVKCTDCPPMVLHFKSQEDTKSDTGEILKNQADLKNLLAMNVHNGEQTVKLLGQLVEIHLKAEKRTGG